MRQLGLVRARMALGLRKHLGQTVGVPHFPKAKRPGLSGLTTQYENV